MTLRRMLAFIVSAAIALPLSAAAQAKIATVDINQVLNQSKEAQKMKKSLDEMSKEAKGKIAAKRKVLQETEKKLKDSKAAEASPEAQKFRSDVRNFDRFVKDTEDEMKQKFMQNNRALAEAALKTVAAYAQAHGIELVLDRTPGTRGGAVLYGSETVDITNQIIQELNK